jgi:hypothetical protein
MNDAFRGAAPFFQHDISSTTNLLFQHENLPKSSSYLAVILAVLAVKMADFSAESAAKWADLFVKGQTWADLGGLNRFGQN